MKAKDWIGYLQGFDEEKEVRFMAVAPLRRLFYPVDHITGITDSEQPTIILELGAPLPFDEAETRAAEKGEKA